MIPKEVIDKIFATAKIEEVVGDYVTLKRRGANLLGLCPFHNEKTPSFTVSPSKGIYKCFGCGKSGHAIGFVMEIEQCSYIDAIKQVAKKYRIDVPEREMTPEEQQRQDDRESMFVVNDFANRWFQDQLWNTEEGRTIGLKYFIERGLHEDTIKRFQLGYSPEKGNNLTKALQKAGYKERFITNDVETKIGTGVSGKSEDGRLYDRFRDRVIFPIHTVSGKTVAFAGRILKKKDNTGKYVNSPDSIIYSKTNELYGLFLAKQAISKADLCYLVEGQMDVISMHQAGIENVVASGGTALTKPQIRLIHRFTSNITVLYDGDAAGIHAALRGIDMFLEEGFNVKVLLLPDGEDPDSFAQSHNASDFIDYIQAHETDFIRFKTQLLSAEAGKDPHKRSELIKDIVSSIAYIPDPITRQVYIKDCSEQMRIGEQLLTREVAYQRRKRYDEAQKASKAPASETSPLSENSAPAQTETPVPTATQTVQEDKYFHDLITNYTNLIRLIIRYGERDVFYITENEMISVGDYIIQALEANHIEPPTPLMAQIIEEYKLHCHEEGFVASNFFTFHPDPAISSFAVDQIADRYQLSRSFQEIKPGKNKEGKEVFVTEADELPTLIPRLLLELQYTIVCRMIEDHEALMNQMQQDPESFHQWQVQYKQLIETRNAVSKALGDRVIIV